MNSSPISRRHLMQAGMAMAAAPLFGQNAIAQVHSGNSDAPKLDPWHGLKVGVATYTFHQKPLEPTIAAIHRVGLAYASIKDMHLPLKSTAEQRKEVAKKFLDAGITPLSCGVVAMPNKEETVKQAFEYARDAGIPTIVISPAEEALPLIEKYVKEFNLRVAIHNHGPEDKMKWHAPSDVWGAVEKLDERIGLCIDVGHTSKAGADPAEAILKYAARLYDVHFKDVADKGPKAKTVECGRGVLDIRGMLQALLDVKYSHAVSFEFEKDAEDPLPGLAETVGYCKGVMSDMKA
jgi:inosose dehydratase